MAAETQINLLIALSENPDSVEGMINPDNVVQSLINILRMVKAGTMSGKVLYYIDEADGTAAAQTVTFTQANATEGETVTVCGVVFTAMVASTPSSDPADGEFSAVTDDDTCGENFATAFNAHPKLKGLATAANSSGTVTITMANKGVFGNNGTLSETGDLAAVGAATFASGAVGTEQEPVTVDQRSKTLA
jgi:hypothetical protein